MLRKRAVELRKNNRYWRSPPNGLMHKNMPNRTKNTQLELYTDDVSFAYANDKTDMGDELLQQSDDVEKAVELLNTQMNRQTFNFDTLKCMIDSIQGSLHKCTNLKPLNLLHNVNLLLCNWTELLKLSKAKLDQTFATYLDEEFSLLVDDDEEHANLDPELVVTQCEKLLNILKPTLQIHHNELMDIIQHINRFYTHSKSIYPLPNDFYDKFIWLTNGKLLASLICTVLWPGHYCAILRAVDSETPSCDIFTSLMARRKDIHLFLYKKRTTFFRDVTLQTLKGLTHYKNVELPPSTINNEVEIITSRKQIKLIKLPELLSRLNIIRDVQIWADIEPESNLLAPVKIIRQNSLNADNNVRYTTILYDTKTRGRFAKYLKSDFEEKYSPNIPINLFIPNSYDTRAPICHIQYQS